jgi:hypothetical protein
MQLIVHASDIICTVNATADVIRLVCLFLIQDLQNIIEYNSGKRRWKGCSCKHKPKACTEDQPCYCRRHKRECDPEVCRSCCRKYGYSPCHCNGVLTQTSRGLFLLL